ncbi:MAG: hypothetical protein ACRDD2_03120 [Sarcina sp.]
MLLKECNVKLDEKEKIIYNSKFKLAIKKENGDIIKAKVIFTDMGKLILEKKDNPLKAIEIFIYDMLKKNKTYLVEVANQKEVKIKTTVFSKEDSYKLNFNIKLSDFIKIYKSLKINPFTITSSFFAININDKDFYIDKLNLNNKLLIINEKEIKKEFIDHYILIGNQLTIHFKKNLYKITTIEIFSFEIPINNLLKYL